MSVYKGVPIVQGKGPEVGDSFTQPFKNLEGYLHSGFVNYSFNNYRLGMFFLVMNCVSWAAYLTLQVPLSLFWHLRSCLPVRNLLCAILHIVMDCWLQGPVLRRYPVMFSMTAFTYMFGFIQVGVLGVISAGKLHFAQFLLTSRDQIIGVLYAVRYSSVTLFVIKSILHSPCWWSWVLRVLVMWSSPNWWTNHMTSMHLKQTAWNRGPQCAGHCRINIQFAAPNVVCSKGRALHCIALCSTTDVDGVTSVCLTSQGHSLHGNVSPSYYWRKLLSSLASIRLNFSEAHNNELINPIYGNLNNIGIFRESNITCMERDVCSCLGGMLTVAGFYMVVYGQGIERRRKQAALEVETHGRLVVAIESNLKQPLLDNWEELYSSSNLLFSFTFLWRFLYFTT